MPEPRTHLPGLEIQQDGTVLISTPDDLDRLLACRVDDLSSEMVMFGERRWLERSDEERSTIATFLNSARAQVCNEGRLPTPRTELPPMGVQVEALHSGKPNPEPRWAVGTITAHEWCSVSKDWRVTATFDSPHGTWCGMPILGTSTFADFIYVLGDLERRAFSSMTVAEIEAFP